ncbi:MAG: hypothetical protein ACYCS7_04690 [Acidimicrobiales bacterium]
MANPILAAAVAAEYIAAHWVCLASAGFDPKYVPRDQGPVGDDLWRSDPGVVAGAVWSAPEDQLARLQTILATRAGAAHDAHHAKYTLACIRAAAADPPARRLFLAAAAYLGAWWAHHPDPLDPLVGQGVDLEDAGMAGGGTVRESDLERVRR